MELPEATAIIKHRVADVVGGVMELWGFKSVLGRLWTLLYLSEEPQSAAQLKDQLSASVGAIASMPYWPCPEREKSCSPC